MAIFERFVAGGGIAEVPVGRKMSQTRIMSWSSNRLVLLKNNGDGVVEMLGSNIKVTNLGVGDVIDPGAISGNVISFAMYYIGDEANISLPENWVKEIEIRNLSETITSVLDCAEAGDLQVNFLKGNDLLIGSNSNNDGTEDELGDSVSGDLLRGYNGNDTIHGNGGDDSLWGDRGNDQINGGTGDDTLIGGAGDDVLNGNSGINELFGGTGNDRYVVNFYAENADKEKHQINDLSGLRDVLEFGFNTGNSNKTSIIAARVNDNRDLLICAVDYDAIGREAYINNFYTAGKLDTNRLLSEVDYSVLVKDQFWPAKNGKLNASIETINLVGFRQFDMRDLSLSSVQNTLTGTEAANFLLSSGESLYGRGGDDILLADTLFSQNVVTLDGGLGNDFLAAALSGCVMLGGPGNDDFVGRNGNDTLEGGAGKDKLEGGGGQDIFRFRSVADSGKTTLTADVIGDNDDNGGLENDFVVGQSKIDLSIIDANLKTSGDQAFGFNGIVAAVNSAWVSADPNLYKSAFNPIGSSILWVDNTGDAKADMCIVIVEVGLSSLLNSTDWLVL
jgi:Ca2+-binding RTX toxin-like protein